VRQERRARTLNGIQRSQCGSRPTESVPYPCPASPTSTLFFFLSRRLPTRKFCWHACRCSAGPLHANLCVDSSSADHDSGSLGRTTVAHAISTASQNAQLRLNLTNSAATAAGQNEEIEEYESKTFLGKAFHPTQPHLRTHPRARGGGATVTAAARVDAGDSILPPQPDASGCGGTEEAAAGEGTETTAVDTPVTTAVCDEGNAEEGNVEDATAAGVGAEIVDSGGGGGAAAEASTESTEATAVDTSVAVTAASDEGNAEEGNVEDATTAEEGTEVVDSGGGGGAAAEASTESAAEGSNEEANAEGSATEEVEVKAEAKAEEGADIEAPAANAESEEATAEVGSSEAQAEAGAAEDTAVATDTAAEEGAAVEAPVSTSKSAEGVADSDGDTPPQ
jgi:hypothetical protein